MSNGGIFAPAAGATGLVSLLKELRALLDVGGVARVRLLDALRVLLEVRRARRRARRPARTAGPARTAARAGAAAAARGPRAATQPAERALQLGDRLRVRRGGHGLRLAHLGEVVGGPDDAALGAPDLGA